MGKTTIFIQCCQNGVIIKKGEKGENVTQLEALKIAYEELSNMMPYRGENDYLFEAADIIRKMIKAKERQLYKRIINKDLGRRGK